MPWLDESVATEGTPFACTPTSNQTFFYYPTGSGGIAMSLGNLDELFLHEVKDLFDAEKQIVKALPKIIKAVETPELLNALEEHLTVTEKHVERLEEVFKLLEKPARGKKCAGMEGLLKEGSSLLEEDAEQPVLEAALIGAAQKVEHYEICAYGTLIAFAQELGYEEIAELLEQSLEEEKEADEALSEISEQVNKAACACEEEEEEPAAAKRK
jgi:ferritin-like metal-binding protein YciE